MKKSGDRFKKDAVRKFDLKPLHRLQEIEQMDAIAKAVDETGRSMDAKWGHGRLPLLCGAEWASRFAAQSFKFKAAYAAQELEEVLKHGSAMERAYQKLDELAVASGADPVAPEQWEFNIDDRLIILVRDKMRMNQVDRKDRRCEVWSLDEIESLMRLYPILAAAKDIFSGAEIIETRPAKCAMKDLNDSLDSLPGWG